MLKATKKQLVLLHLKKLLNCKLFKIGDAPIEVRLFYEMIDILDNHLIAFPPILPKEPHTLILGTMPGAKSLQLNQYYGHPQNQFWKFMGEIYGAHKTLPYEDRIQILKENGIAVWDVLSSCTRIGSMDADIQNATVNDFETFYKEHPTVQRVIFDSLVAEKLYLKHALPTLTRNLTYKRVPSPSPCLCKDGISGKTDFMDESFKIT